MNVQDAEFPASSLTVHITSVWPVLKTVPEAGVHISSSVISMLSDTVGFGYVTNVSDVVKLTGHDIVGFSVSVSRD